MAGVKISSLPAAGAITGTELVAVVQGGITSQTTTAAVAEATGVSTFSGGSTGLTPATATSGAVSLAGTLAVANGGTGVTTSTGTGSTVLSASPTFTGTLGAAAITASTTLGVTGLSTLSGGVTETVTNAVPATSGTARSDFQRIIDVAGSRTADYGISNSGAWIQSRDKNDYSINYPLLLNPNGGNVAVGTTLGVTGVSTLTGGAVIQGLTVGLGANAVAGNIAFGAAPLNSGSLSGSSNLAVGAYPLFANTTGANNTAVGKQALSGNTTGYQNVAVGEAAIASNLVNGYNTALGNAALNLSTGSNNLGLGYGAGSALTTGSNNTIIGSVAGTAGLSDTVIIAAGSAERMRIDSSGAMSVPAKILVGGPTSAAGLFGVQVYGDATTAAPSVVQRGYSNTTAGPNLYLAKTRGTSATSFDAVQSGDVLGTVSFLGSDGAANQSRAAFTGFVDGAVSAGVVPTAFSITTGTTVGTERIRVSSAGDMTVNTGNIIQGTAAKGINFTANTGTAGKTSQLLNWYEEGTFTPTYTSGLTVVGTLTFTGTYTRVGRLVTVFITISSTTSVATGGAISEICRGLPFTPSSGSATGTVVNGGINSSVGFFFNSVAIYSTGATTPSTSIALTATYFV